MARNISVQPRMGTWNINLKTSFTPPNPTVF